MDVLKSLQSQRETVQWSAFWFGSNLAITFYNKYILSGQKISPLINTFSHLGLTWVGSVIANKFEFPNLTFNEKWRLFVYSFVFSFNIVYSQLGMKWTNLSLNQVTRATTPIYQVILEYLIVDRIHSRKSLIPLIPVMVGVGITSLGDVKVTPRGLFVSISSVLVSAFKGVLSMKILQGDLKAKLQEFSFLSVVSPFAIAWIILFELGMRATQNGGILSGGNLEAMFKGGTNSDFILSQEKFKFLIIGGIMAFLTNVASFGTVKRTSASAMGVMANAKQALIIFIAMLLAEKDWTPMKMFGVVVTLLGAIWYSYEKEKERQSKVVTSSSNDNENNANDNNDKNEKNEKNNGNDSNSIKQSLLATPNKNVNIAMDAPARPNVSIQNRAQPRHHNH